MGPSSGVGVIATEFYWCMSRTYFDAILLYAPLIVAALVCIVLYAVVMRPQFANFAPSAYLRHRLPSYVMKTVMIFAEPADHTQTIYMPAAGHVYSLGMVGVYRPVTRDGRRAGTAVMGW